MDRVEYVALWVPSLLLQNSTVEPLYSGHPWEWHFGCYTEVAVVEGFYTGVKLNGDQGYWPLYNRYEGWPLREVSLYYQYS